MPSFDSTSDGKLSRVLAAQAILTRVAQFSQAAAHVFWLLPSTLYYLLLVLHQLTPLCQPVLCCLCAAQAFAGDWGQSAHVRRRGGGWNSPDHRIHTREVVSYPFVPPLVTKHKFVCLKHSEAKQLNIRVLEEGKVYCRAMQGEWLGHTPKT